MTVNGQDLTAAQILALALPKRPRRKRRRILKLTPTTELIEALKP